MLCTFHSSLLTFFSLSLFVSCLILLFGVINIADAQLPPAKEGLEAFSLDKIAEYNSLVDCFSAIKTEFTECNKEALRQGELVLRYIDEGSEFGTLLKCCGTWVVRDCWVKSAQEKCAVESVQQLHTLPVKFMPALKQVCVDYQPGSFYCAVPYIIGGVLVCGFILLLILGSLAAVYYYRRRKLMKGRIEVESDHSNSNNNLNGKPTDVWINKQIC